MKKERRHRVRRISGTARRRRQRREESLRSASLGSPIFVESWHQGSPLNWVEFMRRWETTRTDRRRKTRDD
ncbi:MAG: hypothetical protein P8Y93_04000 [Acidobacteriota bacterium]|jgi:hypothetical protein